MAPRKVSQVHGNATEGSRKTAQEITVGNLNSSGNHFYLSDDNEKDVEFDYEIGDVDNDVEAAFGGQVFSKGNYKL